MFISPKYNAYVLFLRENVEHLMEYQLKTGHNNPKLGRILRQLNDEDPFVCLRGCRQATLLLQVPHWFH